MAVAKFHVGVTFLMMMGMLFLAYSTSKQLEGEYLASGQKTTEEKTNLSHVKPLKSIAYLNRSNLEEDLR